MPLDIALGIFSVMIVTRATPLPFDFLTIALGLFFVLLPDLDFLMHILKKGSNEFSHEHRDLFHNPLLFIPIGFVALLFININLAYLFLLCSTFHFLHDSMGMGWGIRWGYPFSKRYYKLFSNRQGEISRIFLTSWTPEEQRRAAVEFGNPHWMRDYLNFSPELLIEVFILLIAIICLRFI